MKKSPKIVFFILISIGVFWTVLSLIFSPPNFPVLSLIWLILSMGLYWAVDRLLHALGGIAGETERDGVIWLIPLAFGWIPSIIFATNLILAKHNLIAAISMYCVVSYICLTLSRPEIHENYNPVYCEKTGIESAKEIFGLFKYKMHVAIDNKTVSTKMNTFRFPSYSYLFYSICFGFSTLVTSTKEISTVPAYPIALGAAVFTGTGLLISQAFKAKEEDVLWRIQAKEGAVLCLLFGLSALNIYIFLFTMIAIQ